MLEEGNVLRMDCELGWGEQKRGIGRGERLEE